MCALVVILTICAADLIQSCFRQRYPYIASIAKPFVVFTLLSQMRTNF